MNSLLRLVARNNANILYLVRVCGSLLRLHVGSGKTLTKVLFKDTQISTIELHYMRLL